MERLLKKGLKAADVIFAPNHAPFLTGVVLIKAGWNARLNARF